MFKKILIVLIFLAFICLVNTRVCSVADSSSPQNSPKLLGLNKPKDSNNSQIKLIYTGNNETLSEALYHLDLRNGKIDEPHIVHKMFNENKHILTFIGKDNKTKRERIFESENSKIDIYVTQNGKYALVMSDFNETNFGATAQYYDVNGNLLWEKKNSPHYYYISPNGETLLEVNGWDYQVINLPRDLRLLDSKGKVIKELKIEMGDKKFGGISFKFSKNSNYCLMVYGIGPTPSKENKIILIDNTGKILFERYSNGFEINTGQTLPLNDGKVLLDTKFEKPEKRKVTKIVSKTGKELYSISDTLSVVVSSINDLIAIEKKGSIYFVKLPSLAETLIDIDKLRPVPKGHMLFLDMVMSPQEFIYETFATKMDGKARQELNYFHNNTTDVFYAKDKRPYLDYYVTDKYFILKSEYYEPNAPSVMEREIIAYLL